MTEDQDWTIAEIDDEVVVAAEDAAGAAGLSVEAWLRRAIVEAYRREVTGTLAIESVDAAAPESGTGEESAEPASPPTDAQQAAYQPSEEMQPPAVAEQPDQEPAELTRTPLSAGPPSDQPAGPMPGPPVAEQISEGPVQAEPAPSGAKPPDDKSEEPVAETPEPEDSDDDDTTIADDEAETPDDDLPDVPPHEMPAAPHAGRMLTAGRVFMGLLLGLVFTGIAWNVYRNWETNEAPTAPTASVSTGTTTPSPQNVEVKPEAQQPSSNSTVPVETAADQSGNEPSDSDVRQLITAPKPKLPPLPGPATAGDGEQAAASGTLTVEFISPSGEELDSAVVALDSPPTSAATVETAPPAPMATESAVEIEVAEQAATLTEETAASAEDGISPPLPEDEEDSDAPVAENDTATQSDTSVSLAETSSIEEAPPLVPTAKEAVVAEIDSPATVAESTAAAEAEPSAPVSEEATTAEIEPSAPVSEETMVAEADPPAPVAEDTTTVRGDPSLIMTEEDFAAESDTGDGPATVEVAEVAGDEGFSQTDTVPVPADTTGTASAPAESENTVDQPATSTDEPLVPQVALFPPPEKEEDTGPIRRHAPPPGEAPDSVAAFIEAAEGGDSEAQHSLALVYVQGQGVPRDYETAAYWFRESARQGNANAQYNLGVMHEQGVGVAQDRVEALMLYLMAARQGHIVAQYNAGLAYAEGKSIPRDFGAARSWFNAAAEQGLPEAQYNLGVIYENGLGVAKDYIAAYRYYGLAAEAGHDAAPGRRDKVGSQINDDQRARIDDAIAVETGTQSAASLAALDRGGVREVQSLLDDLGFDPGPADGLIGDRTTVAIREYQEREGLRVNGRATAGLLDHLRSSASQ